MSAAPSQVSDPRQNQLIAALPEAVWQRWRNQFEPVDLAAGQVLCDSCSTSTHVVFPTTAIVSLLQLTREGDAAEIAVVGNEGLVGISLLMGGNATPSEVVVQSAGQGYRLSAQAVKNEINSAGEVLHLLLRYTQTLLAQVAQTAVCNRYHSIDQQLSRRLLLGLDRSPTDELVMTQESAASLLGVRREGVTYAASKLQQAGVIRYSRGRIAVLDRHRLEQRSCECYAVGRKEYERLLPAAPGNWRDDSVKTLFAGRPWRNGAPREFDARTGSTGSISTASRPGATKAPNPLEQRALPAARAFGPGASAIARHAPAEPAIAG